MAISAAKGGCNGWTKPELTKKDDCATLMMCVETRHLQVVGADDHLWSIHVIEVDELLAAVFSFHVRGQADRRDADEG